MNRCFCDLGWGGMDCSLRIELTTPQPQLTTIKQSLENTIKMEKKETPYGKIFVSHFLFFFSVFCFFFFWFPNELFKKYDNGNQDHFHSKTMKVFYDFIEFFSFIFEACCNKLFLIHTSL